MRDEERGTARLLRQDRGEHAPLAVGVQVRRGLVEDQERRISQPGRASLHESSASLLQALT